MYYNKRLHPRQYVVEHHRDGCMLHELEEQSKISRYSSLSALSQHSAAACCSSTAQSSPPCGLRTPPRRRLSSTDGASHTERMSQLIEEPSTRRRDYKQRPQSIAGTPTAGCDWSISVAERMRNNANASATSCSTSTKSTTTTTPFKSPALPLPSSSLSHYHHESDDSASTTTSILSHGIKPSLVHKTSAHTLLKNVHFSRDCDEHSMATGSRSVAPVQTQPASYESPEQIIASLFPDKVAKSPRAKKTSVPTAVSRPGGVLKSTKSSTARSVASSAVSTGRKTQLVASPGFGSKSRAGSGARCVFRPDSLQELSRDFEGIKYAYREHLYILEIYTLLYVTYNCCRYRSQIKSTRQR